jgi:HemY protein
MIRFFIYSIIALAVGSALALALAPDPGYVLINFRGTTIEATLAAVLFAVFVIILLGIVIVWLLRLLNPLRWFGRKSGRTTSNALQLLLLGRWQEAYKALVQNADRAEVPELNYMLAAIAAHQRGDEVAWRWCLDQAERHSPGTAQGTRSFRAYLETRAGHSDHALLILLALARTTPAPFVLTQIKDIYVAQGRLDELAALMPELQKHHVIESDERRSLDTDAHAQLLERSAQSGAETLRSAWHDLPKTLKHDARMMAIYARKLLELGQDTEAGTILTTHLKKHWNEELVRTLGLVHVRNPQEALQMTEKWLKQHPDNSVLLLTLGRLSLRNQLWGKAREYFDLALRAPNTPELAAEINAELARLLEHLGERERSVACYQKALGVLNYALPDVPLPAKR